MSAPDPNAKFRTAITPHNVIATWGLAHNDKSKIPYSTHANIGLVLDHRPELLNGACYDEFLDRTLVLDREWRDEDDTGLCMWIQEHIGLSSITPSMVHAVLAYRLRATPRHCVRDWFDSLAWDGTDRIAHALEDFFGAESSAAQPSDYLRAVSANLFLAIVARVLKPGCQHDTMVILEGPQGIGKSSALRVIGGAWYMLAAESIASKDFFQAFPGKLVIEVGEMDSFTRADRERIKLVISTPTDRYRSSYGRRAVDHPRQCVFIGTTNRDDYGNDDTGLRRFLPVRCGDINLAGLAGARPQLFAEAVSRIRSGEPWWETPTIPTLAVQRDRQSEDVWTPLVTDYLVGKTEVHVHDVLREGCKVREADMTHIHKLRIGSILRLSGWSKSNRRRDGRQVKTWVAPADE